MMRRAAALTLLQLTVLTSAYAQSTISIRLYSQHAERRLTITGQTGDFRWRTCAKCAPNSAARLSVELAGNKLQLQSGPAVDRVFVEGAYRINPEQGLKAALTAPLELTPAEGTILVLASVPLEDYVAAALEGEAAILKQPEALKAMAVAIRSYAIHFRGRHRSEGFDLCDSTHCQALNFTGTTAAVRDAVQATRGEMLWYGAEPAATYFHQSCGGQTAAGTEAWPDLNAPYLKSHSDPFCVRATPMVWRAEFSRSQIQDAVQQQGLKAPSNWSRLDITQRTASGRALRLTFTGGDSQAEISASSLRFALGRTYGWNRIRSDLYEIENSGQQIVFRGRGAGHGVGLCQSGAEQMAAEGKSYREILAFYYPGTMLGRSARLNWQERHGARIHLLTTEPEQDASLLPRAESLLQSLESDLGWKLDFVPQIRVFPTLDAYRNATGQPGWIAAYTRGPSISLQPVSVLRGKSALDSTLRHEFLHLLIESRARPETPLWLREGLTLFLAEPDRAHQPVQMTVQQMEAGLQKPADRESLERCYAAARTRVAQLVTDNGRSTVLGWLSGGLPGGTQPTQH
ncbi:MAG TPA: SpoIID/LytB domain-containing protein [Candidatus Limnocylindrales bacterium]|nr:SpoIID/LytB domain-containing protein [Candidatus Limnocylindrales bacterium]